MAAKKATKRVSKARTPPFPNYPAWSMARFWGYVRSGLRSTYNKYPPKWNVLKNAKRAYQGDVKNQKWEYQCNVCGQWHKQKDISVDHRVPCGALNSFDDLPGFVERLFTNEEGLQVICRDCHKIKTLAENKERKEDK